MNVSKKLFFTVILSLGLNLPLLSSEINPTENTQSLFDIISYLRRQANAKSIEMGIWIERAYGTRKGIDQQLVQIANDTTKDLSAKIKAIGALKQNDEQTETQENKSYFSNMSTLAAAAAFIITASIASYFYFMAPWRSSNQ